jgi:hypothetical protein
MTTEVIDEVQNVELFLHSNGHPQIINARLKETLREVLKKLNSVSYEGLFVFVGESED